MSIRLRGRAAVKQRAARIKNHPVCAECAKENIVKATDEIDHIIPLAQGGTDDDDNTQGLCFRHHAIKSALEDNSAAGAATHPLWLQPSAIPINIVVGAPGAGKSYYVEKHAHPDDIIIDLDIIASQINPQFKGQWEKDLLNLSIRRRNAILGALKHAKSGVAWFVVGAPTSRERIWWATVLGCGVKAGGRGAKIIPINTNIEICRHRTKAKGKDPKIVDEYFQKQKMPWGLPKKKITKRAIGVDGYPIENN